MAENVSEGDKEDVDVKPDKDGKYPETVPWNRYVGIKESLGKKLDSEKAKVQSLEEQAKKAVAPDEHTRIKTELDNTKTKLQETSDELKTVKDKTLTEKRDILIKKGVAEDKVKEMSVKECDTVLGVLGVFKPKADLGSGSGDTKLTGSPMSLARDAYSSSNKK